MHSTKHLNSTINQAEEEGEDDVPYDDFNNRYTLELPQVMRERVYFLENIAGSKLERKRVGKFSLLEPSEFGM